MLCTIWLFQISRFVVHAQSNPTIQAILWNIPDGNLADLNQPTLYDGETLPVSWNNYTSTQYLDTTTNLVYLWVSAFDFSLNPFSKLLKKNINMSEPGSYAWYIDIPDDILAVSGKFVLRFKLPTIVYDSSTEELSSPGFLVLRPAAESSTSSTTRAFTSSSTSTTSTLTSSSSTPTSDPSQSSSATPTPGLSSGAKAGIGIGSSIGAVVLLGAAWFFLFHRHKSRETQGQNSSTSDVYQPESNKVQPAQSYEPVPPTELPSGGQWGASELPVHPH